LLHVADGHGRDDDRDYEPHGRAMEDASEHAVAFDAVWPPASYNLCKGPASARPPSHTRSPASSALPSLHGERIARMGLGADMIVV
jgi:hypothetical protein